MKESISSKVTRIISGSTHKLINIIESSMPEVMMEQSIKEIQDAMSEIKSELGKIEATLYLGSKRKIEAENKINDYNELIKIAVDEGKDEHAEAVISQQIDIETQLPIIDSSLKENNNKKIELEKFILALESKIREMKDELKLLKETKVLFDSQTDKENNIEDNISRAEAAFERVVTNIVGKDLTKSSTDMKADREIEELKEIRRKNKIEVRLQKFKQNL
jgi:phage shock protein A